MTYLHQCALTLPTFNEVTCNNECSRGICSEVGKITSSLTIWIIQKHFPPSLMDLHLPHSTRFLSLFTSNTWIFTFQSSLSSPHLPSYPFSSPEPPFYLSLPFSFLLKPPVPHPTLLPPLSSLVSVPPASHRVKGRQRANHLQFLRVSKQLLLVFLGVVRFLWACTSSSFVTFYYCLLL